MRKVHLPERPCPALVGPDLVYGATPAFGALLQEYAILGCGLFDDGCPPADAFEILLFEFIFRDAEVFGNKSDLMASAAVAAAGTFKLQATDIPWSSLGSHEMTLLTTHEKRLRTIIPEPRRDAKQTFMPYARRHRQMPQAA